MFTRENGKMIRLTATVNISILMVRSTRVTGKRISSTVLGKRPGLMEHAMKEIIKMGKRMGKASSCGQMALPTRDSL